MTLIRHELKQSWKSLAIWTAAIGAFIMTCLLIWPEMKGQMQGISSLFSSMGAFTAAFGMDKLNFGTLIGYYAIECGNVLGLGGAFFASLCAVGILSKEEKDGTAEFLLTHPVSRKSILSEKLAAVFIQITAMNVVIWILAIAAIAVIGEAIPWKELNLLHLAYYLMQLELAAICFGISAFVIRGSSGIGLGLAAAMYFLSLLANIADSASFLSYITPFGYCSGADIISKGHLNIPMIVVGAVIAAAGIAAAYIKYSKKDIR